MGAYLIQSGTLTDIADAIREKTGITAAMLPSVMPGLIRSIETGSADTTGIPEDIVTEAERVASSIQSKKGSNAVTFIAMSDMHEMGDSDHADAAIIERYRRANQNAGQAAKLISNRVSLDFCACLGDYAWGANSSSSKTSFYDLTGSIAAAKQYLAPVEENTELIEVCGNHDPLFDINDESGNFITTDLITGIIGSYRYFDIAARKVRVIALNTAEYTTGSSRSTARMTGTQLQWLAEALDLSGKTDASSWGIIILGHHALDYSGLENALALLKAYIAGTSYSVTHNGVAVSYDYAGKNAATVIAQFHGHVHCFKVANIGDTEVQRIAIPNACFGRNNEYGSGGNLTVGESVTCYKTDDHTGRNTAFCLVSIDLDKKIIYADCFGSLGATEPGINAGYDRVISYGEADVTTYTVTNTLTNAATSNGSGSVLAGSSYTAAITADSGYELESIAVTMGGVDITAAAVTGNNISISSVTGDIVITASAKYSVVYDVTNLVLTSEEQNSTDVYNGIGYKNNTRISEDTATPDKELAGYVATGWIPYAWSTDNVLYVRGASITDSTYVRFYGYSSKTEAPRDGAYAYGSTLSNFFTVEELETNYYKLTPLKNITVIQYIRISLLGTGENLIVTVNEEITTESGGSGEEPGGSGVYTNLVPKSLSLDGSTVYGEDYDGDGTPDGYLDDHYASGGVEGDQEGFVATGFLYLDDTVESIYIKGAEWASHERVRFIAFSEISSDQTKISYSVYGNTTGTGLAQFFTVTDYGDNYYKWTLTSSGKNLLVNHYYRLSLVGSGANLIVTHNEPIE